MTEHRRILVVAQTGELASTLVSWLSDSGNDFVLANSYAGAKLHLTSHPDVLITELKLGDTTVCTWRSAARPQVFRPSFSARKTRVSKARPCGSARCTCPRTASIRASSPS